MLIILGEAENCIEEEGNATSQIPVEVKSAGQVFLVFEEPKSLPPHRRQDRRIPLEDGVKGLSLRPYRYSSTQKDVIEKLIQEMM